MDTGEVERCSVVVPWSGSRQSGWHWQLPSRTLHKHPAGNDGQGGWRYAQHNGDVIGPDGKPWETQIPLVPGHSIDRYGSEYGS